MATRELIAGFITNSAALAAATVSPGDSFSVRHNQPGTRIWLDLIALDAVADAEIRIFSANLHDQVNGIRLGANGGEASALTGDRFKQELFEQDALTVQTQSGAADSSALVLGLYYEQLPGTDARLAAWEEIAPRIEEYMGVRNDFTSSATIGTWAGEAINADVDQFIVNRDYAVIGANFDVVTTAVAWRGADTGNVRNGMPAQAGGVDSREYFPRRALALGVPFIPVFNSANRGSLQVETVDNAASTATDVNSILALLRG
jgi:hypothetical protein